MLLYGRRRALLNRFDGLKVGLALERQPSGGHLIKNYTKREYVRQMRNFSPSCCLLRRHIAHGSEQYPRLGKPHLADRTIENRQRLCEPKVEHLNLSSRRDHYVRRLDITMDDSAFVRFG